MGSEVAAPMISKSMCCQNHPNLGRCVPGLDDRHGSETELDGKCWLYCINDCEKGGVCLYQGHAHVCHCYC